MAHRLVFLTHGQQAPIGSTGIMLDNGGIMWIGKDFPATATLGTKLIGDTKPITTYNNKLAAQYKIDEYNYILVESNQQPW